MMTSQDKMFVCFGLIGLAAFAMVLDASSYSFGNDDLAKSDLFESMKRAGVTIARLQEYPRGPIPKNRDEWLVSEDYPAQALNDENEGVLSLKIGVDAFGEVFDCEVTRSSGYVMFDRRACDAISTRARFYPALDEGQQSVKAYYDQTVRWQMED